MPDQDPVLDHLRAYLQQRTAEAATSSDPVLAHLQNYLLQQEGGPVPEDGLGWLKRTGQFLENVLLGPEQGRWEFGVSPQLSAQLKAEGAGVVSPLLSGLQAIAEIPGLFTDQPIATDKAADFLERANINLLTATEEGALASGLTKEQVADAHLFGELVGFTLPVVGALKAGSLLTGIEGGTTAIARNFALDTVGGAIFGGVLTPGETLQERGLNTLGQSAVFGVGGVIMNGLIFGFNGMARNRARRLANDLSLDEILGKLRRGEQVEIGPEHAAALSQLLSEEGFLASSPEAQALLASREQDAAMIHAIKGTAELGESAGVVRSAHTDFTEATASVDRFKAQFPALKFDVIKNPEGAYDVYFGLNGLNNRQKFQLKTEGRYTGQLIEKNGTRYQYVGPGKEGQLIARTIDGNVVHIKAEGVTDLVSALEDVQLPTVGEALYTDFREYVYGKMNEAALSTGQMTEEQIIRGLREGTVRIGDGARRAFDDAGAIAYPEELGTFSRIGNPTEFAKVTPASGVYSAILDNEGKVWISQTPREGHLDAAVQMVKAKFGMTDEQAMDAIAGAVEGQNIDTALAGMSKGLYDSKKNLYVAEPGSPGPARVPIDSPTPFLKRYLETGNEAGTLLPPTPIRNLEDAFQEWLKVRNLTPDAKDIDVFHEGFAQRLRNDLWSQVPEEEMQIFRRIREETLNALEENGTPLNALAAMKGFHVDIEATGQVVLRDINTGARLLYGSEATAREALSKVIRAEKDPMSLYVSPGPHGMPGLTGGFRTVDDVWTFGDNIAAEEFITGAPSPGLSNRRDYFIRLEDTSGIPFFSRGFARLDEALSRLKARQEPISRRVQSIWKGLKRPQREEVALFWADVEGTGLTTAEAVRLARRKGLSSRQIQAYVKSRELFDMGAKMLGLPESRFISNYYSRIQPEYAAGRVPNLRRLLADDPVAMKEYEFWAEKTRTGELSQHELDPEIVMHKYFRGLFYSQEVAPIENDIRKLLSMRIKDLPADKQAAILQRALPETTPDSFILPDEIHSVLKEFLNNVRGNITPGYGTARKFMMKMFDLLGIKAEPTIFDELHNTYLSMQYGAAIGLRPMMMNRNAVQNVWMMYTRVGGKYASESLKRALTQAGFDEALLHNAIRPIEVTVPLGDAIFDSFIGQPEFVRGTGPLSNAIAAGIRRAIRLGRMTRKGAQKFLVPFGSTDEVNRAWAYHWQRMHTEDWLTRFEKGAISWEKFTDEGMPFFDGAVKNEFRARYERFGRDKALGFIGKQAADEGHFIYGAAATPTWMQKPFWRWVGVFGQWPLWAKELYFRRMANGTSSQIARFWVRNLALVGAFANMTAQTGINMWNWLAPLSFTYAGGPFLDVVESARRLINGPMDQKAQEAKNLMNTIGGLTVPGQVFYNEIQSAMDQSDPSQAALMLLLGRPVDKGNYAYDFIYNPESAPLYDSRPQRSITGLPSVEELTRRPRLELGR